MSRIYLLVRLQIDATKATKLQATLTLRIVGTRLVRGPCLPRHALPRPQPQPRSTTRLHASVSPQLQLSCIAGSTQRHNVWQSSTSMIFSCMCQRVLLL